MKQSDALAAARKALAMTPSPDVLAAAHKMQAMAPAVAQSLPTPPPRDRRDEMIRQSFTRERARAAGIDLGVLVNQEIVRRKRSPVRVAGCRRRFTLNNIEKNHVDRMRELERTQPLVEVVERPSA
jgi:hypothetical protein